MQFYAILLPSPKLIIILENRDYIAKMKEKLLEIKQNYKNFKPAPKSGFTKTILISSF